MKQVLNRVAMLKKADAIIQIIAFVVLGFVAVMDGALSYYCMLGMAGVQLLSCVSWMVFFSGDTPRVRSGTIIRRTFLVILITVACCLLVSLKLLLPTAVVMLVVGPVCGLIYFIVTIVEAGFYRKARKPYYLL